MASKNYGFVRTDAGYHLPFVEHGGHDRVLAWLPTPKGHPAHSLPTWSDAGFPTIPLSRMQPFKRVWDCVPVLDQDGRGACLAHAWVSAFMIARAEALGASHHVELSPWFLYSLIDGGVDAGSNAGDACDALTQTGCCPDSLVPYGTIRPAGYNAAAKQAAAGYKLRDAVRIQGFEQAVSAAFFGWCVCFDLSAGPGFEVDQDGVCRYLAGPNNHEVMAGEEFALVNGTPVLGGRNSWGTSWGVQGRCYWTEQHLDNSQETYAVRFADVTPRDAQAFA